MRQVPSSRISTNPISAKDRRSGSQHPEKRFEDAYDVVDAAEAAPKEARADEPPALVAGSIEGTPAASPVEAGIAQLGGGQGPRSSCDRK
jgi:hypothetical protein